ncbi:MAG: helix-turn-helix domain-containing protein [Clostridia bacterium]|nr:helix-turn-helix transcriptional regulator [Clostridiales bacterium]MCR5805263.1 helix-turn-helix domain-containing protein [Clostridia bacterium]
MTIYEKLVQLRKSKGWSQEDLAEKLNVSRQAISRWENGTALPDAVNLRQLSHLYDVSSDYLLNDDYESDDDLPRVKNVEAKLDDTVKKNQKFYLIAAIAFIVAAFAFLFVGIDQLNIVFVVLAVVTAPLSGIFVYRYEKGKKRKV